MLRAVANGFASLSSKDNDRTSNLKPAKICRGVENSCRNAGHSDWQALMSVSPQLIVLESDLRCPCPTGLTGPTVSTPLDLTKMQNFVQGIS